MVNVSARLVNYAIKALQEGGGELLGAIDAGWLPVSTASVLADLSADQQEQALGAGPKFAAARARELRAKTRPAPSHSSMRFRVTRSAEDEDVVFLCIDASCLHAAVAALQARGFRRVSG